MENNSGKPFDPASWFQLWTQWAPPRREYPPGADATETGSSGTGSNGPGQWLDAHLRAWQSLASALTHPDTLAAGLQAVSGLPAHLGSLMFPMIGAASDIYRNAATASKNAADLFASLDLKHPDREAMALWRQVYDQEFQKFFHAPQIGLTRQYQEKINRLMDRFNVLQTALAEFLRFLYAPFEKAHADYARELARAAEKNELPKDAKSQYMVWLKILEGHYMVMYKTPEYLECLGRTIQAAADYSLAKKSVADDVLRALSMPSSDDLEGVYRELHDLGKRMKALEKILQKVNS